MMIGKKGENMKRIIIENSKYEIHYIPNKIMIIKYIEIQIILI